jgi:tRNA G18 (ribose-2'-O)-methylase SpoU
METTVITDPDDDRLVHYRALNDPAHRMQLERTTRLLAVEGMTAIERLLASSLVIESILVTTNKLDRLAAVPVRIGPAAPVYIADRAVLEAVAGFDLHRGAIAIAHRPPNLSLDAVLPWARTVAVLESLTDHENLGSIARAARAFGIDALVLDPRCADPFYRRSIRVSMGEILHLPVVRTTTWPEPLLDLQRAGFRVLGLTADGPTAIDEVRRQPDDRVAMVLGAEGPGLSEAARTHVTDLVAIPISAAVDSLNVGQAAAVAFHVLRNRPTQ